MSFVPDRKCLDCGQRYARPTPVWAAITFIVVGLALAGYGLLSVLLRLASGHACGLPALLVELGLTAAGILAVIHGIRSLAQPGKA